MNEEWNDFKHSRMEGAGIALEVPGEGNEVENGKFIIPSFIPVIIGEITIKAHANDNLEVKFYVNDVLKFIDNKPPYEWRWKEFAVGKIRVVAYTAMDEVDVVVISLFPYLHSL